MRPNWIDKQLLEMAFNTSACMKGKVHLKFISKYWRKLYNLCKVIITDRKTKMQEETTTCGLQILALKNYWPHSLKRKYMSQDSWKWRCRWYNFPTIFLVFTKRRELFRFLSTGKMRTVDRRTCHTLPFPLHQIPHSNYSNLIVLIFSIHI